MPKLGHVVLVQADVFCIGASCGVVFEFKCRDHKEAELVAEEMRIRSAAAARLAGGIPVFESNELVLEGHTLDEIFKEILQDLV